MSSLLHSGAPSRASARGYPTASAAETAGRRLSRSMRVALFITCFNDTLFPQAGRAVVELLERLGCEVAFPEAQTCCGQMHGNTGYADQGLALAERWARVFEGHDIVVSPKRG